MLPQRSGSILYHLFGSYTFVDQSFTDIDKYIAQKKVFEYSTIYRDSLQMSLFYKLLFYALALYFYIALLISNYINISTLCNNGVNAFHNWLFRSRPSLWGFNLGLVLKYAYYKTRFLMYYFI